MNKENNCQCVVCQVEQSLLDSLSTQTARTHFQALAANHPVLNHFNSPADVIARLHDHERVEADNHNAWNGILNALVNAIADGSTENIGQQLLLVAYTPTIHKVYREVCQKFPGLCPEDIAQQAAVCFLETARSPEVHGLNGHLPGALAIRFRRRLFTWAVAETRHSPPLEELSPHGPEPMSDDNFEDGVLVRQLLAKAQRLGVISAAEAELVRKFHCEGCQPEELRDEATGPSGIALYYRVQRAVHRLRRLAGNRAQHGCGRRAVVHADLNAKKISSTALEFSGNTGIRNSEGDFSPELSHVPQVVEHDISQIEA
jgi:hypothetical protein